MDKKTKHGHCSRETGCSPTYKSWMNMKTRCTNKNSSKYSNYGAKGVTISERWMSFHNFLEDMGVRPEGTSIDRIDPLLGYTKDNCRWATIGQQARNKVNTITVEYNGVTKTLSEWSELLGIKYDTLHGRLDNGWTIEKAFSKKGSFTITIDGDCKSLVDWAKQTGLSTEVIRSRYKRGISGINLIKKLKE